MAIVLERLQSRFDDINFALFDNVILFFELVVLFLRSDVSPANHSEAPHAIYVLDGVMAGYEVLRCGFTLKNIGHIRGK